MLYRAVPAHLLANLGKARLSRRQKALQILFTQLQVLTTLQIPSSEQAPKRFMSEQGSSVASSPRSLIPSAEYVYFDGIADSFVQCCDVLLELDDGSELPAHSQILARFSEVWASSLKKHGPASASRKAHLELEDCSRATAIGLMSVLYSPQQYDYLRKNRKSCMTIARIAYKLEMEVSSSASGIPSKSWDEKSCKAL